MTNQQSAEIREESGNLLAKIVKFILMVFIFFMVYNIVNAGSLSPPGSPEASMKSLADIAGSGFSTGTDSLKALYDWIGSDIEDPLTGTYDSSAITSDDDGSLFERLEYIQSNLSSLAYGSDTANLVLTTATEAGTYDASNLTEGVVKAGTTFGVFSTGLYPSGAYPLPSAVSTTLDLEGDDSNITSDNGSVEWWQADGTRQTASVDFPTISNVCSTDTSNGSTGTLSISASSILTGNTVCGTAGTLLADMFNGTGQGVTGGSQADGGVDDYNNNGSAPTNRYETEWTDCTVDNDYCGTDLASADVKDEATGLIWSYPCAGAGCDSFDSTPSIDEMYSFDTSETNNGGFTAAQLCTSGDHGESGWYLPHQKQWMQAYIDGCWGNMTFGDTEKYWTATKRSDTPSTHAWIAMPRRMGTNYAGATLDYSWLTSVRCVRTE